MAIKVLLLCALVSSATAAVKLQEMFSWNVLDWNYPDPYSKQLAVQSGALIPENALPVGIERWRNKLFVTVPRWKEGIPATLNYIPLDGPYNPSPKLSPYPSFAGNELGNCQTGLNTVYRIKADKCDRLWVLDVGTYGYDPNVTNLCPYSLNVYDLRTDQRIRRYVFRPEDIVSSTFIANIALDEGKTCDDTFAYFSDELGYGLIAYSWELNKSWRFNHGYFMPDPLVGDYNIGGLNFQWSAEGIFGITASPMGFDGYRTLYFSPLASNTQFAVSTRILRNETKVSGSYHDFQVVGVRGNNGHTTSKVMDELTGIEFFNLIDQNAIGCWRLGTSYKPQNIGVVDKDDAGLIFPSDIKIDRGRNVWVISDRMPVFLESTLDYSDINFRIYTAPLDLLVQQTVCEPPSQYLQPVKEYQQPNKNSPQQSLEYYGNPQSNFINQKQPLQYFEKPQQPNKIIQQQPLQYYNKPQPSKSSQPQPLQYYDNTQANKINQQPVEYYYNPPTKNVIQKQPLEYYDNGLGVTANPGTYAVFGQLSTPRPLLISTYSPDIVKNPVSSVQSYINIPKQTAAPYVSGRNAKPIGSRNPWWYEKENYEVYEH